MTAGRENCLRQEDIGVVTDAPAYQSPNEGTVVSHALDV